MNQLSSSYFKSNRETFLSKMPDNCAAIFHSALPKTKSGDTEYPYCQNANFFYLTGYNFQGAKLFLIKRPGNNKELFFSELTDEKYAHWFGARPNLAETRFITGIDDCQSADVMPSILEKMLRIVDSLYLDCSEIQGPCGSVTAEGAFANSILSRFPYVRICDASRILTPMRMIKLDWEVAMIKRAIELTHDGLLAMWKNARPGMMEYEIEAFFNFELHRRCTCPAFRSIIAAGKNATVLHYSTNNSKIEAGDLILTDVGAEYSHYSADISRTFPVNGKFEGLQRDLYQLTLEANKSAIAYAKPGRTLAELHSEARKIMVSGLTSIKLISHESDIERRFTHGVSHQLGLDTHDVSSPSPVVLTPGMVITIEPGLYFSEYGMGVRIEDDVLITSDGCENLSCLIPKEMDDLIHILR